MVKTNGATGLVPYPSGGWLKQQVLMSIEADTATPPDRWLDRVGHPSQPASRGAGAHDPPGRLTVAHARVTSGARSRSWWPCSPSCSSVWRPSSSTSGTPAPSGSRCRASRTRRHWPPPTGSTSPAPPTPTAATAAGSSTRSTTTRSRSPPGTPVSAPTRPRSRPRRPARTASPSTAPTTPTEVRVFVPAQRVDTPLSGLMGRSSLTSRRPRPTPASPPARPAAAASACSAPSTHDVQNGNIAVPTATWR